MIEAQKHVEKKYIKKEIKTNKNKKQKHYRPNKI